MASCPQVMLTKTQGEKTEEGWGRDLPGKSPYELRVWMRGKGMKLCWRALIFQYLYTFKPGGESAFGSSLLPAVQPAA